jgi:hypothetical protein
VVGVCLCFHSQSKLKNPEHLKFLHVSSMHQTCVLCNFNLSFIHISLQIKIPVYISFIVTTLI